MSSAKLGFSGRHILEVPAGTRVVVVGDKGGDLSFQFDRQTIIVEQDPGLERLMPALDLALGLRMIGGAASLALGALSVHAASAPFPADFGSSQVVNGEATRCELMVSRDQSDQGLAQKSGDDGRNQESKDLALADLCMVSSNDELAPKGQDSQLKRL